MKTTILLNIPEFLTFKFNSWKKWENEGKTGKYITYSIGVEHKGVDEYFTVYENDYNNIFSKLGDLQGRTLEVGKFQNGKYHNWKIMENGVDITPSWGTGTSPERTVSAPAPISHQSNIQVAPSQKELNLEPLRADIKAGFQKRDDKIAELEARLALLEEVVDKLKNPLSESDQAICRALDIPIVK